MLKRQRALSPIPFSWDAMEDEKTLPEDLFEPSKRRRYSVPPRTGPYAEERGDEEEQDGMHRAEGSLNTVRREVRRGAHEWQKDAGEYKDANSLLHDLHAEQRHRLIFFTTSSTPQVPIDNDSSLGPHTAQHSPAVGPHFQSLQAGSPSTHKPSQSSHAQSHSRDGDSVLEEEAEVVSRRYGETNRYVFLLTTFATTADSTVSVFRLLRSLFLSRRRDNNDP